MNQKIIFLWTVFTLFLLNELPLYCQNLDLDSLVLSYQRDSNHKILESIKLPDSLKRSDQFLECFDDNSLVLQSSNFCLFILGSSYDEEFVVMMGFPSYMSIQDSVSFAELRPILQTVNAIVGAEAPAQTTPGPNTWHLSTLYNNLRYTLGKDTTLSAQFIKENVFYYPHEYARTKFNADSAAIYYFWPRYETKPYKDKYIGSVALMLMKRDTGYVFLYCFYTKNSKLRVKEFMKNLDGIVWFKD